MDHFVLPGDELAVAASKGKLRRNFMGYTVNAAKDWVGIGMSSISYIRNNFAQNQSGINSYNSAIDENRFAVYRGMKLSEDDLIRQHIISELMCNFRLDTLELETKFGIVPAEYLAEELQQLQPFLDDGLLNWDEKVLTVAPAGKLFVRNIAMTFDAYLKSNLPEKSKVKFSRTI
jgi:oxygen-independent coproporphyrinogen-3 oxidase